MPVAAIIIDTLSVVVVMVTPRFIAREEARFRRWRLFSANRTGPTATDHRLRALGISPGGGNRSPALGPNLGVVVGSIPYGRLCVFE
jgi:hypothetical protein